MSTNAVIYQSSSITLDWASVSGANLYHLQVSVDQADFSGSLLVDIAGLVSSIKSFTDTGTDNKKRFWRWRYSTDSGVTWSEWSEVGSYWLLSTIVADVVLSSNTWALINPSSTTDIYTLELFPVYRIMNEILNRNRVRNRQGTLLSEYLTQKANIELMFGNEQFIGHKQMRAFQRFNQVIKTFFLATYKYNGVDTVNHIWKVQFSADPQLTMLAAGRQDYFTGSVQFTEV